MIFAIPLYDDNPTARDPIVNYLVIGLCVGAFLWQLGQVERAVLYSYGMVPARLFGLWHPPRAYQIVPVWTTLVTSMFLHGGWFHLIGNMLFLWIFGNNIEDVLGHWRYLVFYLCCGVIAALTQAIVVKLHRLYTSNQSWRIYRRALIEENKWRAARYGIEGKLIDFGKEAEVPMKVLIPELLELVDDVVDDLGSRSAVNYVHTILNEGTSAERQLKVYQETGDLREVVRHLVAETRAGSREKKPTSAHAVN